MCRHQWPLARVKLTAQYKYASFNRTSWWRLIKINILYLCQQHSISPNVCIKAWINSSCALGSKTSKGGTWTKSESSQAQKSISFWFKEYLLLECSRVILHCVCISVHIIYTKLESSRVQKPIRLSFKEGMPELPTTNVPTLFAFYNPSHKHHMRQFWTTEWMCLLDLHRWHLHIHAHRHTHTHTHIHTHTHSSSVQRNKRISHAHIHT